MRFLLLIIILIFSEICFSQNCETKKDAFSGKSITTSTKSIELQNDAGERLLSNDFKLIKEDGNYFLEIKFIPRKIMSHNIEIDDAIEMILEDGSRFKYFPIQEVIPSKEINTVYASSIYTIKMKIEKNDIEKMAISNFTNIRINIDQSYDYFPHKMQKGALKKMANCILES